MRGGGSFLSNPTDLRCDLVSTHPRGLAFDHVEYLEKHGQPCRVKVVSLGDRSLLHALGLRPGDIR